MDLAHNDDRMPNAYVDKYGNQYADRDIHADFHADADSDEHVYAYTDLDQYIHADSDGNQYVYSYRNGDEYIYTHPNKYTDAGVCCQRHRHLRQRRYRNRSKRRSGCSSRCRRFTIAIRYNNGVGHLLA